MTTELLLPQDHIRMDHAGFIYEILFKSGMLKQLNRFPENRSTIEASALSLLSMSQLEARLMRWRETGSSPSETRPVEELLETLHYQTSTEAEATFSALLDQFNKLHKKAHGGCFPELLKLYAPVNLDDLQIDHDRGWIDDDRLEDDALTFHEATGWNDDNNRGLRKGEAGRADWLALYHLKAVDQELRQRDKGYLVLHVSEFSLFASDYVRSDQSLHNFGSQYTHLNMLKSRIAHVNDQSAYQKINLNTSELESVLSAQSFSTLMMSATVNKSLYKLCQAASYAVDALQRIVRYEPELLNRSPRLMLLCHAFTNRNQQAISVRFKTKALLGAREQLAQVYRSDNLELLALNDIGDSRWPLMVTMARAYRSLTQSVDTHTVEGYTQFKTHYARYGKTVSQGFKETELNRFIRHMYKQDLSVRVDINSGSIQAQYQPFAKDASPSEKEINPLLHELNLGFESSFKQSFNDYCNPAAPFTQGQIEASFPLDQSVDDNVLDRFGDHPFKIIQRHREVYEHKYQGERDYTSRDAHAALIEAFFERAATGKINLLFLEGHPGVGKTTTIQTTLLNHPIFKSDGFMAMYFSPRIVINGDLHKKFAYKDDDKSNTNICTLTCDSYINRAFQSSLKSLFDGTGDQTLQLSDTDTAILKRISAGKESCVCCSGVDITLDDSGDFKTGLLSRQNNEKILILHDSLFDTIKSETEHKTHRSTQIDQNNQLINLEHVGGMGVFSSMAIAQRELMRLNPDHNRFLMTASIQGLKSFVRNNGESSSTVDAFDQLFEHKVSKETKLCRDVSEAVKCERRALLKRMPTIMIMVDELTGDSSGSLLVDRLYSWLYRNLIMPLEEDEEQFKIILVVADASLTNEYVMNAYFDPVRSNASHQPAQVLVSDARHETEVSLSTYPVNISSEFNSRRFNNITRCGHVKTNAYPARSLTIEHKIITHIRQRYRQFKEQDRIKLTEKHSGFEKKRLKAYLAKSVYEALIRNHDADVDQQVLLFYQDKKGLDSIEEMLVRSTEGETFDEILGEEGCDTLTQAITERGLWLKSDDIMIVNNQTMQNPALRNEITSEETRQRIKVFLVTSTLSRGISLPKANTIIAHNQRFSVESGLAELNQVIFRCRGRYKENGVEINSDLFDKFIVLVSETTESFYSPDPQQPIDEMNTVRLTKSRLSLSTHLSLIQNSIMTRIYGYSTLSSATSHEDRRVSIVPVGPVGISGMTQPFSQKLVTLVNDLERLSTNRHFKSAKKGEEIDATALVKNLIKMIVSIFVNQTVSSHLQTTDHPHEKDTVADDRIDQHYFERASNNDNLAAFIPGERVFNHHNAVKGGLIILPLKQTLGVDFSLDTKSMRTLKVINSMLYSLMTETIRPNSRLNRDFGDLCANINAFLNVFKRSNLEDVNTSYIERVETGNHYLIVPAAYPILKRIEEQYDEEWLSTLLSQTEALSYGANDVKLIAPLIGIYDKKHNRGYPFIIVESMQHPANWDMLLGDKALMATRELNILSLIF